MRRRAKPSRIPMGWSGIIVLDSRGSRRAAIMFNSMYRKMHLRQKLRTTLTTCREMLDAFVSYQMRHTAAEARYVRPKYRLGS
jgi:hypothetical protein